MNRMLSFIKDGQAIICVCPCCDEIFQIMHARFIFPTSKPGKCLYGEIKAISNRVAREEQDLNLIEERYNNWIQKIKERSRDSGRRLAKRKLIKVDHIFSARKIDPQDVKVIFDPIEYCIFSGMTKESIRSIDLISRMPNNKSSEKNIKEISSAIKKGDYSFDTMRIDANGVIDLKTEE